MNKYMYIVFAIYIIFDSLTIFQYKKRIKQLEEENKALKKMNKIEG